MIKDLSKTADREASEKLKLTPRSNAADVTSTQRKHLQPKVDENLPGKLGGGKQAY